MANSSNTVPPQIAQIMWQFLSEHSIPQVK